MCGRRSSFAARPTALLPLFAIYEPGFARGGARALARAAGIRSAIYRFMFLGKPCVRFSRQDPTPLAAYLALLEEVTHPAPMDDRRFQRRCQAADWRGPWARGGHVSRRPGRCAAAQRKRAMWLGSRTSFAWCVSTARKPASEAGGVTGDADACGRHVTGTVPTTARRRCHRRSRFSGVAMSPSSKSSSSEGRRRRLLRLVFGLLRRLVLFCRRCSLASP